MAVGTAHQHDAYAIGRTIVFLRRQGRDDLARELCISALEEGMPNALVGVAWEQGGS